MNLKNLAMWGIIVFLTIGLYNMFKSPQPNSRAGNQIIFSDFLDQFKIGGFKIGFWFAQQGSIYFFVFLIFIYVYLMNKLDKSYKEKMNKNKSD